MRYSPMKWFLCSLSILVLVIALEITRKKDSLDELTPKCGPDLVGEVRIYRKTEQLVKCNHIQNNRYAWLVEKEDRDMSRGWSYF